jgi:hypothetical protein
MVPQCIIFTKDQSEKDGWGALKWAVILLAEIFSFGWTDGNPVHMLSTANGSHQWTTVSRQVRKDKHDIRIPKMVRMHNFYMQGVNRHDQLRGGFSLMKRQHLNKWYVKMWLALIDIALANGSIC